MEEMTILEEVAWAAEDGEDIKMEESGNVFYEFDFEGLRLKLTQIDDKVYLGCDKIPEYKQELALRRPGHYNTSTNSSVYDERGEVNYKFKDLVSDGDKGIVEMEITTTGEYWYYGSLDDDWHEKGDVLEKKRLIVERESGRLKGRLEDID